MSNFSVIHKLKHGHWPIFLLSNISALVNMILPIVLVRLFSPRDMGFYKTFFLYLSLIPFLTMAGGPLNSIYYWMGKNSEDRDEYLRSTWMATTLLSSMIFIAGVILYFFFKTVIVFSPSVYVMLLVSGFLVCPSGHFAEVCIARGKTVIGASLSMSFELIKTAGFIFIAWKYKNVDYIFIYFFIMMLMSSLLMLITGIKTKTLTFHIDRKRLFQILNYSLPVSLSAFLLFIIDKADQLMLTGLVDSEIFAYYSMGCLIIPPLYILETSVQKHLIPQLSQHYSDENYTEMKEHFRKAIGHIAYLIIPAVFGLIFFAKPIIHLLYTAAYDQSVPFLQIFALSYLLLLIPHDSVLRASGKTSSILKIYLLITPLSFLGIYLSARFMGIEWALIFSLVVKLIPKIYCFKQSANIMKAPVLDLIPSKQISFYVVLSVVLTVISLALKNTFPNELTWLIVCAPLFAIIYIGVFVARDVKAH